jgi:hypothetical protein
MDGWPLCVIYFFYYFVYFYTDGGDPYKKLKYFGDEAKFNHSILHDEEIRTGFFIIFFFIYFFFFYC